MDKKYLTITALTHYIKHKLDRDSHLQDIYVQGEISNFYLHRMSGHMYLTLKDENSQIKAVMFRGDNQSLKFTPETGMSVFITGSVSVYIANGQYQLYIKRMEPSGIGALHLAFEQLKKKLQKENYFSPEHKKPIPLYPKKIAVITSQDSAAVRDIITTIEKRYPIVQLIILPVNVQGTQAAPAIIDAIKRANTYDFDTIILARGGGSIEDLASFNDEKVAMAIFHSEIPIITGIGHETDTTISDFVADLRAPTPTGAAHYAVPSLEETKRKLTYLHNEIKRLTSISFMEKREQLKRLAQASSFTNPLRIIREKEQRIDQLTDRLATTAQEKIYRKERTLTQLIQRLQKNHPSETLTLSAQHINMLQATLENMVRAKYKAKEHQLALSIEKLTLLNPLHIMKRGYTITYSEEDELIKSASQLKKQDTIKLTLYDGEAMCEVKEVEDKKYE